MNNRIRDRSHLKLIPQFIGSIKNTTSIKISKQTSRTKQMMTAYLDELQILSSQQNWLLMAYNWKMQRYRPVTSASNSPELLPAEFSAMTLYFPELSPDAFFMVTVLRFAVVSIEVWADWAMGVSLWYQVMVGAGFPVTLACSVSDVPPLTFWILLYLASMSTFGSAKSKNWTHDQVYPSVNLVKPY